MTQRKQHIATALPGSCSEAGRRLWEREAPCRHTKRLLTELLPTASAWLPPVGASLYQLAAIELGWRFAKLLEQSGPAEVADRLPEDAPQAASRLARVSGIDLDGHVGRLEQAEPALLSACRAPSLEDFRRPRQLDGCAVTPE